MSTISLNSIQSNILDGRKISESVREDVKYNITKLQNFKNVRPPKLAVILVGDRRDSSTYVSMKQKACDGCNITSELHRFDSSVTQEVLELKVIELSSDKSVDGILVQLPLPPHIDEPSVLNKISYEKDVDGLLPISVGRLALKGYIPLYKPCTAEGCVELCRRGGVQLEGKHVVIVGRSNIVGMPSALLFQQENATVTVCHSKTVDIKKHCREADVLIAAIGRPKFIKGDMVREGSVVIDVGINAVEDPTKKSGYKLVGDVDFDECVDKCKLITPVPGGVGPMTVAMLMNNTYNGWKTKVENGEAL